MAENNEESMRRESEARDDSAKSAKKLTDAFNDLIARSKSAEDKFKTLNKELDRGKKKFSDIAEELADLRDTIEEVTDAERKKTLMAQLEVKESKTRSALLTKLAVDGMAGLVGGLTVGVAQVSKSLISSYQSNAGAFDMAGNAMLAGIDATFSTTKTLAATATAVGGSMMMIPGWTQALGAAMAAVGTVAGLVVAKLEGNAKAVVEIGMKELEATSKFYQSITTSGALFANGLKEFRDTASRANLTQGEFAKILGENNAIFAQYGGSVANGAKTFSNASKAMDPFRKGLLNLGYSFEEQASGLAQVMELNALSGQANKKSAADLAKETDSYLTNLRAISAFTGEDVKKAQARARDASAQAAVQAKLAGMDPEARKRFQASIQMLPAELQKGVQQMFVAGTITDPEMAAALSNNAAAMEILNNATKYTSDANMDAAEVTRRMKDDLRRLGPEMEAQANALGNSVGVATLLTGQFQQLSKITEALQQLAIKSKNIDEDNVDEAEKLKTTSDKLTKSYANANIASQNLKISIQKILTPAIENFAAVLEVEQVNIENAVRKMVEIFNLATPPSPERRADLERRRNKTGKPGSPVPESGPMVTDLSKLNMPDDIRNKSKEGISQSLYDTLISSTLSGKTITSLRRGSGAHATGKAADIRLRDVSDEEALAMLQELLPMTKFAQIETGGDAKLQARLQKAFEAIGGDPSKIVAAGDGYHLHIEAMAKGGITNGVSIAGEAGPEAVIPLPDGRTVPVKMDTGELGSKMDEMIRLLRDQVDNSGRMLHAIQ